VNADNFMSRMSEYMNAAESNTIFTDDLRSAICLAESDDDVAITVQMARRSVVSVGSVLDSIIACCLSNSCLV